jgi:hypothetical protein
MLSAEKKIKKLLTGNSGDLGKLVSKDNIK